MVLGAALAVTNWHYWSKICILVKYDTYHIYICFSASMSQPKKRRRLDDGMKEEISDMMKEMFEKAVPDMADMVVAKMAAITGGQQAQQQAETKTNGPQDANTTANPQQEPASEPTQRGAQAMEKPTHNKGNDDLGPLHAGTQHS